MKKITLLCVFIVFFSGVTAGGGWPQNKNNGYIKLSHYRIKANYFFDETGSIIPIQTISYFNNTFYAEYGITSRFTAITNFSFFSGSIQKENTTLNIAKDKIYSLGDSDITLKYGLIPKGKIVLSTSLTFGIPLGINHGGVEQNLQTGDGEFNQMISIDLSGSFGGGKFYFSTLMGFNNRTENFSDEIRYGFELVYKYSKIWSINRAYGIKSLNTGNESSIYSLGIFNNNTEFFSITPEIVYEAKENFGITFSAGFAPYGKRIMANPSFSAGIYMKFIQ